MRQAFIVTKCLTKSTYFKVKIASILFTMRQFNFQKKKKEGKISGIYLSVV